MARICPALVLALLLGSCVSTPLSEGRAARVGEDGEDGAGDAGPDDPGVPAAPLVPTVRQDLSSWACRADGAPQRVAFFDADSTLRVSKSGAVTAEDPGDVNILPFVAGTIADLTRRGYLVAVVSNQGGISSGHQTDDDAQGALAFTVAQLAALGAPVPYFDYAEAYDEYRKPQTGMAARLDGLLTARCGAGIDRASSMMIGDSAYKKNVDGPSPDGRAADDFSNSDRLFADNLGVAFAEPKDVFGWRAFEVYNIASEADLRSFLEAIEVEAQRLVETGTDPVRAMLLRDEALAIRSVDGL